IGELVMNCIFDAPVDDKGVQFKKHLDRSQNLVLSSHEAVEIQIAFSDQYFGICVADQFGTLKKETVLRFIRQDFKNSEFKMEGEKKGGLGLNGIIQSGLSLLFICRPKVRTEVMLFFPRVKNFRDFR